MYSKENEPNDAMRQVVPQTMDGYPDQDFDSDSIGVISSTLDVYEAVATISYREGLPKPAHDPLAAVSLLSSREIILSFPNGYPITPANMFHVSLYVVNPFVSCLDCRQSVKLAWTGWGTGIVYVI